MARIDLPLMALNAVLFPQMVLRLRVADPRHRAMVARCLEGDRTFGVVLVRSEDKAGDVDPYRVGTTAHIVDATELQGNRTLVMVHGQRRFRLLDYRPAGAYPTGRVEWLPQLPPATPVETGEVMELLERYLARVLSQIAPDSSQRDVGLPDDPEELSYAVAALLPLSLTEKQRLLEIPGPEERIRNEVALLREQVEGGNRADGSGRWAFRPIGKPDFDWLLHWTN